MRVEILTVRVPTMISTVLLVGLVTIAAIVLGSCSAWDQGATRTTGQPPQFVAIDLNPDGFIESWGSGISNGHQVGYGYGPATGGYGHALLWGGTAASVIDLHPSGFLISRVWSISGGQQVGAGINPRPGGTHALLWTGNAARVVDLNPEGFVWSEATGISGGQQVGWGYSPATGGRSHALLWRGTARSIVDLHPPRFGASAALGISGAQEVGYGSSGLCEKGSPSGSYCEYTAVLWHGTASSASNLGEGRAYGTSGEQQVGLGGKGAALWTGSPASIVNLTPDGFHSAVATATSGKEQVGHGGPWVGQHALLWRGSLGSLVDLHAFLPPGFAGSYAAGIDANGDIVGAAWGPATDNRVHAFLWTQNAKQMVSPVRPIDKFGTFFGPTAKSVGVYTSSALFLLTDPLGNASGYDPASKTTIEEIPASQFMVSINPDDLHPSAPDPPPFRQLHIGDPKDGQYTLDVIGIGPGNFAVEVRVGDAEGNQIAHVYSGATVPGRVTRFSFSGQVIPFASFDATVNINDTTKLFEAGGTFNLGPGGTISPLTQPVSIRFHDWSVTIPAGAFEQGQQGNFVFKGTVSGIALEADLTPVGGNGYAFKFKGAGADLARYLAHYGNPTSVMLAIGSTGGSRKVKIEYVR